MRYGLSHQTLRTLDSIFSKYQGIRQAILYGIRAKGNHRNGSDIDVALKTDVNFAFADLLRLANDFDDSDIPYFVDVSIYDDISNPDLKAHIERMGKVIYPGDANAPAESGKRIACLPFVSCYICPMIIE